MHSKPTEQTEPKLPTGIQRRHSRQCASVVDGRRCDCTPSYRAWVFDRRTKAREFQTFAGKGALAAAKQWRATASSHVAAGTHVAQSRQTLDAAAQSWLVGAKANPPTVTTRGGQPYKPSALREYERNLDKYLLEEFGAQRLTDIGRADLNAYVERLKGRGLSGSKIRNVMIPLRVIFAREIDLGNATANPTTGLKLPNGSKPRDRAATPEEAKELLAPLPDDVSAIYATAFYAGLRRGELQALRWDAVDIAAGVIHVDRAWDEVAGDVAPKSEKGTRTVPIQAVLRDVLVELKARTNRDRQDFVFGREARLPFTPTHVRDRAAAAWTAANVQRIADALSAAAAEASDEDLAAAAVVCLREDRAVAADDLVTIAKIGLDLQTAERATRDVDLLAPIGLHECRHTFVSIAHAAGLTLEEIGDYVGHASSYMTDKYRHLLKGHELENVRKLDAFLARADTAGRLEQLDGA